jgi:hypothetical protein
MIHGPSNVETECLLRGTTLNVLRVNLSRPVANVERYRLVLNVKEALIAITQRVKRPVTE